MKRSLIPLIFLLILIGTVEAATWSYTGYLKAGDKIVINENITVTVDYDKNKHVYFAIIETPSRRDFLVINQTESVNLVGVQLSFTEFNNYTVVSIQSGQALSVAVNPKEGKFSISKYLAEISKLKDKIAELTKENEQLKEKIKSLTSQTSQQQKPQQSKTKPSQQTDFNKLQLKLLNLTKENRKLKEKLANLTQKYNALKGESQYLKEQLKTYQAVFSGLVQQIEQQSESNYIDEAKSEKKSAKRLWGALILSGLFVGGLGLILERKRRKYLRT
ncbi:hypothetical protein VFC49_06975 [Thermococcus sp. SY098]|uniref:hypothetical protein n=1 Tax=Thermococcus sp. SY098 TaxID=3111325 RepID=UPI002D77CF5C|nr:hypothetical protein [Thermococcus sp. SY098]WRS51828.1 hypothetical protein VFC49_06975 [Thermococcus sp. SY098]